jgi:hypothetical protein
MNELRHWGRDRGKDIWVLPDGSKFHGEEKDAMIAAGLAEPETPKEEAPALTEEQKQTEAAAKAKAKADRDAKKKADDEAKAKAGAQKDPAAEAAAKAKAEAEKAKKADPE